MTYHWTYGNFEAASDLEQGDFLLPNEGLRAVLADVHPHFCNNKYVGFIVATQSCDLVRRGQEVTARYINIAAVRSLRMVLPSLMRSVAKEPVAGVFLKSSKAKVTELLQRIVDQNEQALGLFYMHNDELLQIGDPSVAYLRVTVALRSQHYDALLAARTGRLAAAFQAKLGWLLGNLYSRPATQDWSDADGGKETSRKVIDGLLGKLAWVGEPEFKALRSAEPDFAELSPDELVRRAGRQPVKRPMDELVEVHAELVKERAEQWFEARLKTFEHHLRKLERLVVPELENATAHFDAGGASAPRRALSRSETDEVMRLARQAFSEVTPKENDSAIAGYRNDRRAKQLANRLG